MDELKPQQSPPDGYKTNKFHMVLLVIYLILAIGAFFPTIGTIIYIVMGLRILLNFVLLFSVVAGFDAFLIVLKFAKNASLPGVIFVIFASIGLGIATFWMSFGSLVILYIAGGGKIGF